MLVQPRRIALVLALAAVAACSDRRSVGPRGVPDRDGTPDLIVDQALLSSSLTFGTETIRDGSCTSIEGNIPPGTYHTLRFSVATPNIGDADAYIGDPLVHIDPNGDGSYDDSDGLFEFAPCHGHFHYRRYATYELLPVLPGGGLGAPIRARKIGFCMQDSEPYLPDVESSAWVYRRCGTPRQSGNQGIAVGWSDVYDKDLDGQFFLLDDPVTPIAPGPHVLRITVNPAYTRGPGDPCPTADGAECRVFTESNYANNVTEIPVTIP